MKFIVSTILIVLLSFAAGLYFAWWSIAIVAFVIAALIPQRPFKSFITGFVAVFLLWAALSFWISNNNDHILAHKVSMLILKIDNPYLLILATGLIGGIVAGFAALTASFLKKKKTMRHTY